MGNKATAANSSKHCCPMRATIPCRGGSRSRYEASSRRSCQNRQDAAPLHPRGRGSELMPFCRCAITVNKGDGQSKANHPQDSLAAAVLSAGVVPHHPPRKLEQPPHQSDPNPTRVSFRSALCRLQINLHEHSGNAREGSGRVVCDKLGGRGGGARASEACRTGHTPDRLCQIH